MEEPRDTAENAEASRDLLRLTLHVLVCRNRWFAFLLRPKPKIAGLVGPRRGRAGSIRVWSDWDLKFVKVPFQAQRGEIDEGAQLGGKKARLGKNQMHRHGGGVTCVRIGTRRP
jgi:hypothetical protein